MRRPAGISALIVGCAMLVGCGTTGPIIPDMADHSLPLDRDGPAAPLTTTIDDSIPDKYRHAIEGAQIEGRLLYLEDRAAWIATDVVKARGILDQYRATATGWLSLQQDTDGLVWRVLFTAGSDENPAAYAEVEVDFTQQPARTSILPLAAPRPLGDFEQLLDAARRGFLHKEWLRCAKTYNTSTQFLRDEGRDFVVLRLMPAWTDVAQRPMGGFHRFRVPLGGNGVVEYFAQTQTCLVDADTRPGSESTFVMTLINSPVPTEFDVFESLSYGRPHYVITSAGSWLVDAGRVRWLDKTEEAKP